MDKINENFCTPLFCASEFCTCIALVQNVCFQTFTEMKRIQLAKYHDAPDEEKDSIDCNPATIFHKAIENSKPLLVLQPVKRGAVTYQVKLVVTSE